jgi:catechol 2,3-dioxygenase-like lactoylglutathione lyase family enzyme
MPDERISSRDILIQTEEIEAACEFYKRRLGLSIFMQEETIIGLETGAFRLFLERGTPYGPVFEFFVDDLEVAKQELTAAGCRIEIEDASVPKCYIRDPYGLTFNIAQR